MFRFHIYMSAIGHLVTSTVLLATLTFIIFVLNQEDPNHKPDKIDFQDYEELHGVSIGLNGDFRDMNEDYKGLDGESKDLNTNSRELHGASIVLIENSRHGKEMIGKITLNMSGPSFRIWGNDASNSLCSKYKTRLGIGIQRVWLVSYPCSGNTWLRYLLEAATGVFTGSYYNDKSLYNKGFLGEHENVNSGTTLTQKTHGLTLYTGKPPVLDSLYRKYVIDPTIPTILLLRNPLSSIISYWKYKKNTKHVNPHTAEVHITSFQSSEFHKFVKLSTHLWEQLAVDVLLQTEAPVYLIHYEHLKEDTTHYLRLLLEFLGLSVDEQRMSCVLLHLTGSFKRSKRKQNFDPYTQDEKDRFAVAISKVHRLIKGMGHPDPPLYNNLIL